MDPSVVGEYEAVNVPHAAREASREIQDLQDIVKRREERFSGQLGLAGRRIG